MEQINLFEDKPDIRLSYSSSTLLQNCEARYYNYKVLKTPKDRDAASREESHFAIGKSFHYVLEMSNHEKPKDINELLEKCVQDEGLKEEDMGLVHAMVLQYLRLRKGSGFEAVVCEYALEHKDIIGYVDLVEKRENGDWFISDLKSAASFYDSKISELPSNQQLNLYCSFYKDIAKKYGLDPEKFQGARYLVCTKSKARQQKRETYSQYVMRMIEKQLVKAIFITIPKELMRIDEARAEHMKLYERSLELRKGKIKPNKNLTYCNSFFKSCEFFSRCHGMEHSEFLNLNQIVIERTK